MDTNTNEITKADADDTKVIYIVRLCSLCNRNEPIAFTRNSLPNSICVIQSQCREFQNSRNCLDIQIK